MSEGDADKVLSDELVQFCESDSLSEEGLREIIERFGVTPNTKMDHLHGIDEFKYYFFIKACDNDNVTEAMIRYLMKYFPDAPRVAECYERTPLHIACENRSASLKMIQLLIEAAPDSVRHADEEGDLPIHSLCRRQSGGNEKAAMEILKLLLDEHPESVRHVAKDGTLPLLDAAAKRSPEFCRMLVDLYPDSVQIINRRDEVPLESACVSNTLPTVEYLYKLYPDGINHIERRGYYPIHWVLSGLQPWGGRNNPKDVLDIVQFLIHCDARVKLQKHRGRSLLCFACCKVMQYEEQFIETGIKIIKAIYDAYPEAIDNANIDFNFHRWHEEVQTFINSEMIYARQARDHRFMTSPDENGQFPLHRALRNNVRLGSIKLLSEGNLSAARNADNNGSIPLHIACQYHESPRVIEHLIDLHPTTLQRVDSNQNTVLHYACRGANYNAIALLLDKYNAGLVSTRNVHNQLSFELLIQSISVEDRESVEYTDCVFRLLRVYPETLL